MTLAEIGAVGTLSVAIVTYVANVVLERRNKVADRRAEAYVDYLICMSRVAGIRDRTLPDYSKADVGMLEAKHRIMLYGSKGVVWELAALHDGDSAFVTTEAGRKQYCRLLNAMRQDCAKGSLSEFEIVRTLMAPTPDPIPPGHPRHFQNHLSLHVWLTTCVASQLAKG